MSPPISADLIFFFSGLNRQADGHGQSVASEENQERREECDEPTSFFFASLFLVCRGCSSGSLGVVVFESFSVVLVSGLAVSACDGVCVIGGACGVVGHARMIALNGHCEASHKGMKFMLVLEWSGRRSGYGSDVVG